MSYALNLREFGRGVGGDTRSSVMWSAGAHVFFLLLMASSSLVVLPRTPVPQLAIEAVIVDESKLNKAAEQERQREQEVQQRKVEEEQQRLAEEERRRQAAEQQRRAEEQRRQQQLQEKRAAEEQQRRAADQRRAEEERQKAAQREREAAAERRRQEDARKAAESRAQAQRQAELAAAIAAEEELFAAQSSGEMNIYIARIKQKVERNWVKPATALPGLSCEVRVRQLPSGDVVDVKTVRCNGDDTVQRSIENAVRRASPLPLPENRMLFERNITFIFEPAS
jgi:colicin import membrane protein